MLELLFEEIFIFLFIVIGYFFGFPLVMLGSLGLVDPGDLDHVRDYKFLRKQGMKFWHLTYVVDGRRFLPAEGVALIGWLVIAAVVATVWFVFHTFSWI